MAEEPRKIRAQCVVCWQAQHRYTQMWFSQWLFHLEVLRLKRGGVSRVTSEVEQLREPTKYHLIHEDTAHPPIHLAVHRLCEHTPLKIVG